MAKICAGCVYRIRYNYGDRSTGWGCDYIGIEGHHRPCRAGDDCTEFKPLVTGKKPRLPQLFVSPNGRPGDSFPERDKLYAEGLGDHEMARRLGTTPSIICAWRRRHGYAANVPPSASPEKLAERERLYKRGLTDEQIAAEQGVSFGAITLWRKRRGYAKNQ